MRAFHARPLASPWTYAFAGDAIGEQIRALEMDQALVAFSWRDTDDDHPWAERE